MNNSLTQDILNESAAYFIIDENIALEHQLITQSYETFQIIDGSKCQSVATLMGTLKDTLGFPDHFGHNWSALVDSLQDILTGLEDDHNHFILVFDKADLLLKENQEAQIDLVESLNDAIEIVMDPEDKTMDVRILFIVNDAKNTAIGHALSATNSIGRVISGRMGH